MITDREYEPPKLPKYKAQIDIWNGRAKCKAVCTNKLELENYLHPDAIKAIAPNFPASIQDFDDVPLMLAEALHTSDLAAPPWPTVQKDKRKDKSSAAKKRLNTECVSKMTPLLLASSDPQGEIVSWLRHMASAINS